MELTRRSVLSGMAAGGVSLTFIGTASASEGQSRYLVQGRGNGLHRRLEGAGFSVDAELADGTVLRVSGPADAADDLHSITGVSTASVDPQFEVEVPTAVETVEADAAQASAPAFFENQWDKHVTQAVEAHEHATGDGTSIAILDTGIDPDHPDLVDNLNVDDSEWFSSLDPVLDPDPWDYEGHGTNVAGIAAASGAVGVIGTAPDAELLSLKVFFRTLNDEDEIILSTTTGDILEAIDHAATLGVDAANLSLGTDPIPPQANADQIKVIYQQVIQQATRQGTVVVASAGNSAANLQQGGYFTVPNSTAGAASISATAPDDGLAYYSNYGTNEIDVGAPGGAYDNAADTLVGYQEWFDAGAPSLISLDPREAGADGTLWLDEDGIPTSDPDEVDSSIQHPIPEWPVPFNFVFNAVNGGVYAWFAGTSMAAPQVAGLVGLVRDLAPAMNANQVEQAIKHGADGVNGNNSPEFGAGRLNALETVERIS